MNRISVHFNVVNFVISKSDISKYSHISKSIMSIICTHFLTSFSFQLFLSQSTGISSKFSGSVTGKFTLRYQ